ncbi:MAG: hypothetical protein RL641_649 [Candidatus Parcubacteria bacterium]|jgi:PAS domain S-box-containing protein
MKPETNNSTNTTIVTIQRIIFFICAAVALMGCLVLVGWTLDNEFLKAIFPGMGEMSPRTALAFVIGGIAVIATGAPRYRPYLLSTACIIFAFGFFRLYGDAANLYYENEYSTTILIVALLFVFIILIAKTLMRIKRLVEGNKRLEKQMKENSKKMNSTARQLTQKQKELREKTKEIETSKRVTHSLHDNLEIGKKEIESQQARDSAIFESINEAIFAVDDKGVIILFNQIAEQISGYTAMEALGVHFTKILEFENEHTKAPSNHFVTEALIGKKVETAGQTVIVTKNNDRIPIAESSAPITHSDGKVVGAVVVFRDLTKEYEVDKAKTEFVSLASHQLRTPLSAMKWHLKMLLKGDLGELKPEQKEFLSIIDISNERMIGLINSFLSVSRIESGKIKIESEVINLKDLAESVRAEIMPELDAKKMTCNIKFGILPDIMSDQMLLRQVFVNLISNAIKYSPNGGKIEVAAKQDGDKKNIIVEVRDTGYGIPAIDRHHVFEKFYRSASNQKYDTEGTGLGLYLVKAIIEALGGTIWFESEEKHGTTFSFTLPLQVAKNATLSPETGNVSVQANEAQTPEAKIAEQKIAQPNASEIPTTDIKFEKSV